MAEEDGLGHHLLRHELRAGLDHHDRVTGAGHDEIELGVLELRDGRVDDELAVDPADPDRADRTLERDLADRERGRRGDRAEDVGVVLLVRREHRDDDLDVILVALGEERPDRAVGEAAGEDGGLGRPRFALDEAARDLPAAYIRSSKSIVSGKKSRPGAAPTGWQCRGRPVSPYRP